MQELKIDEENEEIRILYTLSSMLSDKEEIIRSNSRTVEKLDFIFAKGKLSLEQEGDSARDKYGQTYPDQEWKTSSDG